MQLLSGARTLLANRWAQLLLRESCTVTIAHSRTKDLPAVCANADILVAAVGRPEMITGDYVKPGATVIDVGINRVPAPERGEGKFRLTGDVDYASAAEKAGAITPVPGGVGPMTIAVCCATRRLPPRAGSMFRLVTYSFLPVRCLCRGRVGQLGQEPGK